MKKFTPKLLALSGMFLALGLVLPFLTGQIPAVGSRLLPMHIPILLCGFICGWPSGIIVGFVTPLLRSMLFGMPPMFPSALAMAFELAAYGLMTGLLYKIFPRHKAFTYATLLISMVFGRIVWGGASFILYGLMSREFTFRLFLSGAFITALPGIILQIIIIPAIINKLESAGLIGRDSNGQAKHKESADKLI